MEKNTNHRSVICSLCADEIASRGDLITVLQCPSIVAAYHVKCYSKRAQGLNPLGRPLNSAASSWLIPLVTLACLVLFFISDFNPIFLVVGTIMPTIRFISWVAYERQTPNAER